MSTPSPFELGAAIGGNVSGAIRGSQERSAIDDILEQASSSGNPQDIDFAMQQILQRVSPERQQSALGILQNKKQQIQATQARQQQAEAYTEQGLSPSLAALDPSIQREIVKGKAAGDQKAIESKQDVQGAFKRVNEILGTGATGVSLGAITPKGRELRAELDTLSEQFLGALIPILNPRGTLSQSRFKYIQSLVPQSGDTDAKIKGKMKGLKKIFNLEDGAGEPTAAPQGTREMRDAQGNIFDIPAELYEKALSQGLK